MYFAQAGNPEYNFSSSVENFSIGEILAPFIVFGDRDAVTVEKEKVLFFFGRSHPLQSLSGY